MRTMSPKQRGDEPWKRGGDAALVILYYKEKDVACTAKFRAGRAQRRWNNKGVTSGKTFRILQTERRKSREGRCLALNICRRTASVSWEDREGQDGSAPCL